MYLQSKLLQLLAIVALFYGAEMCTTSADCAHGAMCYDNKCECLTGFDGPTCADIVVMAHNPCINGGSCKAGVFPCECQCTEEYTGKRCEKKNYCFHNLCNGGTCISRDHHHECTSCPAGQYGYNCQIYDVCASNPCNNGATCQQDSNTGYSCICTPDYYGTNCDFQDPCGTNPCNYGTCTSDGSGGYTCTCDYGYLLPDCEIFSICTTNPEVCQNGGTCNDNGMSYTCTCAVGFLGLDCATVDPCALQPCGNTGTCVVTGNIYQCNCKFGFGGTNCDIAENQSCGFENDDLCFFSQVPNGVNGDIFDWRFNEGASGSSKTGPSAAAEGTTYMYIETSRPRISGDNAVLQSPILCGETIWCLQFQYNMYGSNIDTLAVKTQVVGQSETVTWSKQGDQGTSWYSQSITLSNTGDFKFAFEGIRGDGFKGDIAIDDVKILHGTC